MKNLKQTKKIRGPNQQQGAFIKKPHKNKNKISKKITQNWGGGGGGGVFRFRSHTNSSAY